MMCWNLQGKSRDTSHFHTARGGVPGVLLTNPDVPAGGVGGFVNTSYWSSSELSFLYAWYQDFNTGNQYYNYKNSALRVRAVRAFTN